MVALRKPAFYTAVCLDCGVVFDVDRRPGREPNSVSQHCPECYGNAEVIAETDRSHPAVHSRTGRHTDFPGGRR